ncbi:MAG: type II toxin-antitoxin system VapC family toxin [Caulobacter sp.]|nr:type II toxin-antitoxin system VapC family toxin [Caulobacter sp.]
MWLLDTNIVSEMRKARPHGGVLAWMNRQAQADLFISAATIGEIQVGIERSRTANPAKAIEIEAWLDTFATDDRVLPADGAVFRQWAKLMTGRSVDLKMDAMIAATAFVHGLTVATRNVRDFEALGLKVENPFDG